MNRYQFAFKRGDERGDELWTMEETKEITQEDWDKFVREMDNLTFALNRCGQPFGFRPMGMSKKKCLFE